MHSQNMNHQKSQCRVCSVGLVFSILTNHFPATVVNFRKSGPNPTTLHDLPRPALPAWLGESEEEE